MTVGPTELLFVIINVIVILAIPTIVIVSVVFLIRRIRYLEARVAKLEEEDNRRKSA